MIKVLFFAKLKQQLNCQQLDIAAKNISNIAELKAALIKLQPQWQPYLFAHNIIAAVNQETANGSSAVKAGDEIAFFPPVTGG